MYCIGRIRALALLALATPLLAGPKEVDETHPRTAGQPLEIVLTPYYCTQCLKKGYIEVEEPRDLEFMRKPVEEVAKVAGVRRGWIAIETPNFRIFSTMKGSRVRGRDSQFAAADLRRLKEIFPGLKANGGAYLNAHQRAHLYHVRLERIYSHFAALTANKQRWLGMKDRYEAYLFEDVKHYQAFSEKVVGRSPGRTRVVQHHEDVGGPNFQLIATAARLHKNGDRYVNHVVIHSAVHMLVNGHKNYYTDTWAWLEEGLAHYYERRESTEHNHFCLGQGSAPTGFIRGNWRRKIRHSVDRGKEPSLGEWCEKLQPQQLAVWERALSWSLVEWLVETDPVRLSKLLDHASDYKNKPKAEQAIQEVFGVSPDVLHERWRAHVLEKGKG